MLRTFFWIIWLFGYLLVSLPEYWKAKRLGKQGRVAEQQAMVRKKVKGWATLLLKKTGVKLEVEGLENLPPAEEAVAFASNHQSYFDIPVLLAGLDYPRALLAKNELSKVPLLSGWMNLLGCLYVDRHDVRASVKVLKDCEQLLKTGSSLIICPEGTRSKADEMGEFKPGIVRLAAKAKVRIVPIAIDGTFRALEGNGLRMQKCKVRMVMLPAMETANLSKEEQKTLPAKLEGMINEAKNNRPRGWDWHYSAK